MPKDVRVRLSLPFAESAFIELEKSASSGMFTKFLQENGLFLMLAEYLGEQGRVTDAADVYRHNLYMPFEAAHLYMAGAESGKSFGRENLIIIALECWEEYILDCMFLDNPDLDTVCGNLKLIDNVLASWGHQLPKNICYRMSLLRSFQRIFVSFDSAPDSSWEALGDLTTRAWSLDETLGILSLSCELWRDQGLLIKLEKFKVLKIFAGY
ncbi:hypothetical protein BC829DRAFT_269152 [Chytridium lagenaria]|nr:hypothetical protein BC829DRAFT_269152 [Chytridium lagenaria]